MSIIATCQSQTLLDALQHLTLQLPCNIYVSHAAHSSGSGNIYWSPFWRRGLGISLVVIEYCEVWQSGLSEAAGVALIE